MSYLNLLIIGFIVGLSGAMLPGPMLIYTISKVLQGKMISGVKIVLGHMLVEAVAIILILRGLKEIIGLGIVSLLLSLIGGLALILMGLYIVFKANYVRLPKESKLSFSADTSLTSKPQPSGCSKFSLRRIQGVDLVIGGIFFTAFNPTFPSWWITVGASLIFKALLSGITGVVILTLGHWLADFFWYGSVSFAVCKGKTLLNDTRYRLILRILGFSLIGLGSYFIVSVF